MFLDECLKESLLLEPNLLRVISELNNTCLVYSNIMANYTANMKINNTISVILLI